jgi:steroid 5-alpha reductase family enzyme
MEHFSFPNNTLLFVPGLVIQFSSDETKHIFKEDGRNKGKVLKKGLWGVVKHLNYTGYLM